MVTSDVLGEGFPGAAKFGEALFEAVLRQSSELKQLNRKRSVGRENSVQAIGLIGVTKKFVYTWLVNQIFLYCRGNQVIVLNFADQLVAP